MIKILGKLFLMQMPFLLIGGLIGGYLLYMGFTTKDDALTADGYSLKNFFFMTGAFIGVFPVILSICITIFSLRKAKRLNKIVTEGKQGKAVVLKLEDTGVTINDAPRVKLLLEIQIPNYPAYQAEKKVTIPIIYLSQVQVGSTVEFWADPEDPNNQNKIALGLK